MQSGKNFHGIEVHSTIAYIIWSQKCWLFPDYNYCDINEVIIIILCHYTLVSYAKTVDWWGTGQLPIHRDTNNNRDVGADNVWQKCMHLNGESVLII